jgi:hypothetical protein
MLFTMLGDLILVITSDVRGSSGLLIETSSAIIFGRNYISPTSSGFDIKNAPVMAKTGVARKQVARGLSRKVQDFLRALHVSPASYE